MLKKFKSIARIELKEDVISDIEVLRVETLHDRGLKITMKMLEDFVANFKAGVVGQYDEAGMPELPVNMQHESGAEAPGWIKDLYIDGDKMMAKVEWTKLGEEKITNKLFKFVSAEFWGAYPHHKTGKLVKNVFTGLALTNTPALKAQKPLKLSEDTNSLINTSMFKKFLNAFKLQEFVTKEQKVALREALEELPEEEKVEHEEEVKEVEAKPEEPKVEETEEEKKAREEKEAEEAKKKEEEEGKKKEMTEKLENYNKLEVEHKELKAKFELKEITEDVQNNLCVSKEKTVGFLSENKDKVAKFMVGLTQEQRSEFNELMGLVRSVDLSIIGSSSAGEAKMNDKMKEAQKLAEERAKEKGISLHVALGQVYDEMGLDEVK